MGVNASALHTRTCSPILLRAIAVRTGSMSLPMTAAATPSRAASSAPTEHVTSCTTKPASRAARCLATAAGVACCRASSVNNQWSTRPSLAAALRRSCTVCAKTAA
ncbi:Uncharacterised protein [Mycobacteroides abscessus subsp. abscessus]|nr:Uncharacterised protein [Mycobacteroides abscessus subsp. abscessus]